MGLLLDAVYVCVSIAASPWIAYRLTRTRSWSTLPRRLGLGLPREMRGCICVHASSVGEVSLLRPLIRLLEQNAPDERIVISAFTRTGHAAARASYPAHEVVYFPLDLSFVAARFLRRLAPRLVVVVESELWPNFLRAALDRGVDVAILNGKMSRRSYRVHRRLGIVPRLLARADVIAVQSAEHAERFRSLGASADHVFVTGNMKYDLANVAAAHGARASLRADLGYSPEDVVVIGGSLHAGEDRALLEALTKLGAAARDAALVLVPRYPERARATADAVRARGRVAVLQTDVDAARVRAPGREGVLVVDVIGRLGDLYAAADIAFVGGSLYYRGAGKGGHNLMEPAVLGVPVVFGPYNESFKDTVEDLLGEDAAARVASVDELVCVLRQWLVDADVRRRVGERGKLVIERGRGATRRNFDLLLNLPCMVEARLQGNADPSTMPQAADSETR